MGLAMLPASLPWRPQARQGLLPPVSGKRMGSSIYAVHSCLLFQGPLSRERTKKEGAVCPFRETAPHLFECLVAQERAPSSFSRRTQSFAPWACLNMSTCPIGGSFAPWSAQFFLEIRQDSREKIACQGPKSLAAGHIVKVQISPGGRCAGGAGTPVPPAGSSTPGADHAAPHSAGYPG